MQTLNLAIFDLDNTLLGGDSDYLWGQFLAARGVVDEDRYEVENERFYRAYLDGTLDVHEFLSFALQPLKQYDLETLRAWREQFLEERIRPIVLPAARELLRLHRERGDQLLIITATNSFVTAPIARELGVSELLATEPEIRGGRFTGEVVGTPCFQSGKVERLLQWLDAQEHAFERQWFYSDSANDIPLLRHVDHAVAVDPDARLEAEARRRGWPVASLRRERGRDVFQRALKRA